MLKPEDIKEAERDQEIMRDVEGDIDYHLRNHWDIRRPKMQLAFNISDFRYDLTKLFDETKSFQELCEKYKENGWNCFLYEQQDTKQKFVVFKQPGADQHMEPEFLTPIVDDIDNDF